MVNDIIDGLSLQINAEFGDEYRIYCGAIKQGLIEPCFLIAALSPSQIQRVGARCFSENGFDIHFFSKSDDESGMYSTANRLFEALKYVTLLNGDMLRGTKMRFQIVDSILHFFVNYNLFLITDLEEDKMDTISINAGYREE